MNKKIIVRIAEGIGNQLFMYAHAYSLSKILITIYLLIIHLDILKKKSIKTLPT